VIVGVERVDVGAPFVEPRVELEPEQATIAAVVDLGPQVGEKVRRPVFGAVEDLDRAALLGDEDVTVGREAERDRPLQALDRDRVLEALGQGRLGRRRGGDRQRRQAGC